MRTRGVQPRFDAAELQRMCVEERLSTVQISRRTGMSTSGITAALERAGIERRPLGADLEMDDDMLRRLYVEQRVDLQEIADRHGVAAWAVRRRLRAAGIRRPNGSPPGHQPAPPTSELERLYVHEGVTQADLAVRYGEKHATVRRWLEHAGITIRTVPKATGRRPEEPPELTRDALWDLYVDQDVTAREIAQHFGVSKKIVLIALHALRIPVRPTGPSQRSAVVLLEALYARIRTSLPPSPGTGSPAARRQGGLENAGQPRPT